MNNLLPFAIVWAILALVVIVLAFMRKNVAAKEDDTLHLTGGGATAAVEDQVKTANKLAALDKWGKILTAVAVVYGLVLGAFYGMHLWEASSRAGM